MVIAVSDDYGRKRNLPLLPLSFDRVNEGRFPRSNSLLFKLPFEVLGQILQHVVPTSLPSLALVNRDCRQLARSRQFASVHLDTSDSCLELMELLRVEDEERKANSTIPSPSLSPCIRRVKVTEGYMWEDRFQIDTADDSWMELDEETRNQRLLEANTFYDGTYLPAVQYILSSRRILPHLEELELQCQGPFPLPFFNSLTQSSIQHLKLRMFSLYEDFSIVPLSLLGKPWPLRTLHLELIPDHSRNEVTTVPLTISILGLCAPVLESLTWIDRCHKGGYSFATAVSDSTPCFTNLRNVNLSHISFDDSSMLYAFLQNSPCTLGITACSGSGFSEFLQNRGSIPSLKAFDLSAFHDEINGPLLCFLKTNTHLSMLSLPIPTSALFLETQLLPLLSNSFWKLTSLSLCWDVTSISERALEMISSLESLQQIVLNAGKLSGWRPSFEIDHKAMRKHLLKLNNLKKLAFINDTYRTGPEVDPLGYYFDQRYFAAEEATSIKEHERIWEERHRSRMLPEADQYGQIMPQLVWLFVGQIQWGFKELSSTEEPLGTKRTAVPLSTERDTCWMLLREMFGLYEGRS